MKYRSLWPPVQQLYRAVIASVGAPDDMQLLSRIIQIQAVGHLLVNHQLFVVSADKEGHLRQLFVRQLRRRERFDKPLLDLNHQPKYQTITYVGVNHHRSHYPKDDLKRIHIDV